MKVEAEKMTEEFVRDMAEVFDKHQDVPFPTKIAYVAANLGKMCRVGLVDPKKDLGSVLQLCIEFVVRGAGGSVAEVEVVSPSEESSDNPSPLN
jgi:hypothetical protein